MSFLPFFPSPRHAGLQPLDTRLKALSLSRPHVISSPEECINRVLFFSWPGLSTNVGTHSFPRIPSHRCAAPSFLRASYPFFTRKITCLFCWIVFFSVYASSSPAYPHRRLPPVKTLRKRYPMLSRHLFRNRNFPRRLCTTFPPLPSLDLVVRVRPDFCCTRGLLSTTQPGLSSENAVWSYLPRYDYFPR